MSVAQQLYEGVDVKETGTVSLVTYIRTDSVRISEEATEEARQLIGETFGRKYVPSSPRRYANKSSAQDAHEAIRPAHFDLPPEKVRDSLTSDQYRLYRLVWERFLASQMPPADIDTVTVDTLAASQVFRAVGETIRFDGFLAAYADLSVDREEGEKDDEDDAKERIPELDEGEPLDLSGLTPEQKFTKPPARYTEATLIKALEENGIGRPSTYAPTISTILDRKYVDKEKKFLFPTELGKLVTSLLRTGFPQIVDIGFTADMESRLDGVEQGEKRWVEVLRDFYPPFHALVEKMKKETERVKVPEVPTGEKCPTCAEGDLVYKEGRFGRFIACSRYPECKFTRNVEQTVKGNCPKCGSGLAVRVSKKFKGKRFYTCDRKGAAPECDFISWDLPIEGRKCETCGSHMVWKSFKGRGFPKCGNRDCPTNANRRKKETTDA
jgi:DNA topoisomerase-1